MMKTSLVWLEKCGKSANQPPSAIPILVKNLKKKIRLVLSVLLWLDIFFGRKNHLFFCFDVSCKRYERSEKTRTTT